MALRGRSSPVLAVVAAAMLLQLALLWTSPASAQPVDSNSCTSAIISMAPCLDYITGNASAPILACCQQFANVLSTQPACLCLVLHGAASRYGVSVNQTRALAMPSLCQIQTPPVSKCNSVVAVEGPVGAPPPEGVPRTSKATSKATMSAKITISLVLLLVMLM